MTLASLAATSGHIPSMCPAAAVAHTTSQLTQAFMTAQYHMQHRAVVTMLLTYIAMWITLDLQWSVGV